MAVKMRVEKVTKIFGNQPQRALKMLQKGVSKDEILQTTGQVVGVDDASFEIEDGEIFVVMGLSGSGKSTLIRCLNRLHEPTSGTVMIDDKIDVTKAKKSELQEIRRSKMAMVFQHFGLFPHKTVGYNVSYGLRTRGGLSEDVLREKALESLKMVGLSDWIDYRPSNLSGGMQQRVGLARALATDVDILLMDEAFSALDPLIRRQMQDELIRLQGQLKKTIVFITHDLNEALRVGNKVAIMRDGKIVQIGTPIDIVTKPADEYVSRFMADVDQSKVLTAEFIMRPAHRLTHKDTVQTALEKMEKFDVNGLYVVDSQNMPDGLVRRAYLYEMQEKGENELKKALLGNYPTISPLTELTNIYNSYEEHLPLAVVNEHGRLQGVIYASDIINALADTTDVPDVVKA